MFLKYNGFPQRFIDLNYNNGQNECFVGETGFGTGLNFLVSAYHFLNSCPDAPKSQRLIFTSVEKYPLSRVQLEQAYQVFQSKWPQLTKVCNELLQYYSDDVTKGAPKMFSWSLCDQQIMLNLIIDEATRGFEHWHQTHHHAMDAWYLDGFAPAKNPKMWQDELFMVLANLSQPGTTISTFTAAGIVKRGLTNAGFKLSKAPGYGKKREMLYGFYEADSSCAT